MSGRVYHGDNADLRAEGKLAGMAEMAGSVDLDQTMREANELMDRFQEEVADANHHGKKDDAGKQQWYAMPLCVLKDLADTFNHGHRLYGLFNCLQEFENPKERFWDALMRHLEACQIDPLAKDEKSGCYHAACVAFNALMYLYHCKRAKNEKV